MNAPQENKEKPVDLNLSKKIYRLKGEISFLGKLLNQSSRRIWLDGVEILPEMGFALRPFYGCSFEWGRYGAGPSWTTSLSICLSIFRNERIAENLYGCFKEEIVQHLPKGDFEIDIDISGFLEKFKERLHPHLYSRFCYSSLINSKEILLYKDPLSGEITADLAENYAIHNASIPNSRVRELNQRKQRLLFRLFAKDKYIIKGNDFIEIMQQVEDIMSVFYWKSLERVMKRQSLNKFN